MSMETVCCGLGVGDKLPDFIMETFVPAKGDFGEFSIKKQKQNRKWTILFFYPADFTFV